MAFESMNLKILLPFGVFAEKQNVKSIMVETQEGAYGILPNRLDGVAALVPGILTYQTEGGHEIYVAVDEGVMAKTGADVLVSVRNAIGGKDLGKLRKAVDQEFKELHRHEKDIQTVVARLESGFIRQLQKLYED